MSTIGILGAGTWGMALASVLAKAGNRVTVWSALPQEVDSLSQTRRHPNLPGLEIPREIGFTKELQAVCTGMDFLIFAVPSVFVRSTAQKAAPYIAPGQVIIDVAKGIENDTLLTMTQVMAQEISAPGIRLVALSGPTHAEEVALDLPTTIVSACADTQTAQQVQALFHNTCIRAYTNSDVLGVELSGAMKNVIALAAGISAGLGFGDNSKAAIITRGIAEITRLGLAMGCQEQTFGGLAGIGDLIVTATSVHSRNNRCGMLLGQGVPAQEAIRQVGMVVEGLNALPAAMQLAQRYQVEMPIVTAVDAVVSGRAAPMDAVWNLMGRQNKPEQN